MKFFELIKKFFCNEKQHLEKKNNSAYKAEKDVIEEHKDLLDGKWGHWSHRKDFKLFEVRNEGGENKCYVLFKNGTEQLLGIWH